MLPPAAMHLEQKQSTERMTGTQQQYLHQYCNQCCHDDQNQHPRHPLKQQGYRYRRHYRNDHYHHHHHHRCHHHHRHKHQLIPETDQPPQHNSRHSRNTDCRRTMSPLSSSIMPHNDNSPSTQRATSMFVTGKSVTIIIDSNLSNFFRNVSNICVIFLRRKGNTVIESPRRS